MSCTHEGIYKGNTGSSFSRSRGHYQKEITLFLFNTFHHRADCTDLIIPSGDFRIYELISKPFPVFSNILKPLQVISCRVTDYFSWRIVFQIPEENLKTVGIKAERKFAAKLLLNMVTVLFSLFPS